MSDQYIAIMRLWNRNNPLLTKKSSSHPFLLAFYCSRIQLVKSWKSSTRMEVPFYQNFWSITWVYVPCKGLSTLSLESFAKVEIYVVVPITCRTCWLWWPSRRSLAIVPWDKMRKNYFSDNFLNGNVVLVFSDSFPVSFWTFKLLFLRKFLWCPKLFHRK